MQRVRPLDHLVQRPLALLLVRFLDALPLLVQVFMHPWKRLPEPLHLRAQDPNFRC